MAVSGRRNGAGHRSAFFERLASAGFSLVVVDVVVGHHRFVEIQFLDSSHVKPGTEIVVVAAPFG